MPATTAKYAEGTTVAVGSSQLEARRMLKRFGAGQTRITDAEDRAILEFVLQDRLIRFLVAAPELDAPEVARDRYGARRPEKERQRLAQAEYRRRWRALLLRLKARLEAVTNEGVAVEEEFLAHLVVDHAGRTVGDILLPQIEEVYRTGRVPALMSPTTGRPMLPALTENGGEE
jgi:hypothetical protein